MKKINVFLTALIISMVLMACSGVGPGDPNPISGTGGTNGNTEPVLKWPDKLSGNWIMAGVNNESIDAINLYSLFFNGTSKFCTEIKIRSLSAPVPYFLSEEESNRTFTLILLNESPLSFNVREDATGEEYVVKYEFNGDNLLIPDFGGIENHQYFYMMNDMGPYEAAMQTGEYISAN